MARDEVSTAREAPVLDGTGLRIGVICGRFNDRITSRLLEGALARLDELHVDPADRTVRWVPGAFEVPFGAKQLALTGGVDAVVTLGAVIRGETGHYDFVAGECARGIQSVQLETGVPVSFGVLTTDTVEQALARSDVEGDNKGAEAVEVAIEMALYARDPLGSEEET